MSAFLLEDEHRKFHQNDEKLSSFLKNRRRGRLPGDEHEHGRAVRAVLHDELPGRVRRLLEHLGRAQTLGGPDAAGLGEFGRFVHAWLE